jgi:hypothetical protein
MLESHIQRTQVDRIGRKERKKESDKRREKFTNTLFKIEVGDLEKNKGIKKRSIQIIEIINEE